MTAATSNFRLLRGPYGTCLLRYQVGNARQQTHISFRARAAVTANETAQVDISDLYLVQKIGKKMIFITVF